MDTMNSCFWIGQSWQRDSLPVGGNPVGLRKTITLEEVCKSAQLRITAKPEYSIWINGMLAGNGPVRTASGYCEYDTLDIGEYLKKGENELAVCLSPFTGSIGHSDITRMGVIFEGEINTASGVVKIVSDESFFAKPLNVYGFCGNLLSIPTHFQEHYNACCADAHWQTSKEYLKWNGAWVMGKLNTPPFTHIGPRSINAVTETDVKAQICYAGRDNGAAAPTRSNLSISFNKRSIIAGKFNRSQESFTVGENNVFCFDFGKIMSVRPGLKITNIKSKCRIELYYSDRFYGNIPNSSRGFNEPYEGFADSVTADDDFNWQALYYKGFRFMSVRVVGGECTFELDCRRVEYAFGGIKPFNSGDATLDRIYNISAETIKTSTTDSYVDCCGRENAMWSFDACIIARAAYYTFNETKMWSHILRELARGIDGQGIPKSVGLTFDSCYQRLFDQCLYHVVSAAEYYEFTGDTQLMREIADSEYRFLCYCEKHITSEDLYVPPDYSWTWVDWAAIDKRPYNLAVNAMLVLAARAAVVIGNAAKSDKLISVGERIDKLLSKSCEKFFSVQKNAFLTHINPQTDIGWYNDYCFNKADEKVECCMHANALAWYVVADESMKAAAVDYLRKTASMPIYSRENYFGPGWTELILSPLCQCGYTQTAIDYIKKVYGRVMDSGSPVWAEGFAEEPYTTGHGWGSIVNALLIKFYQQPQ